MMELTEAWITDRGDSMLQLCQDREHHIAALEHLQPPKAQRMMQWRTSNLKPSTILKWDSRPATEALFYSDAAFAGAVWHENISSQFSSSELCKATQSQLRQLAARNNKEAKKVLEQIAANLGAEDYDDEAAVDETALDAGADDEKEAVPRVHHVPVHAAIKNVYKGCATAWVSGLVGASECGREVTPVINCRLAVSSGVCM